MWSRQESMRPVSARASGGKYSAGQTSGLEGKSIGDARRSGADVVNIGQSVVIKGEVHGSEDLFIEGRVEGKIEMRENVLTIGPNGIIKGGLFAKSVIVLGKVTGNITATEKIDLRNKGAVDGDLAAPRVAITEGALFRGSVDMQSRVAPEVPGEAKSTHEKIEAKPVAKPSNAKFEPRWVRAGLR